MLATRTLTVLLATLMVAASAADQPADTLVIAPPDFQGALADWKKLRERQGHRLLIDAPPADANSLLALIKQAAAPGTLRNVLLIGDAPPWGQPPTVARTQLTPIGYATAVVNVSWGGLPHIASDNIYADLDGDVAPDLAIGRIPCRDREQLKQYLDRVVAREASAAGPPNGIHVVASPGRFTPWLDRMIELTAQSVFKQLTPEDCPLTALYALPHSEHCPEGSFREAVQQGLQQDALAWVYLGHGDTCQLDRLWDEPGSPCILCCEDFKAAGGTKSPLLAALVACRTGRIDFHESCLAEAIIASPSGPLAVLASSRVSMPYGNSVLGAELMHCLFKHSGPIGEVVAEAKRRALSDNSDLPLRAAIKQIGLGLSANADRLDLEVAEHVQMYNLLGDPLLRVRQ